MPTSPKELWEQLGRDDPMWAILSDPRKKNGKWDKDEFYRTGEGDVARFLALGDAIFEVRLQGHALDFGCGIGRMAKPFLDRFDTYTGVDIAQSMLDQAPKYDRARYVLAEQIEGHFDFGISHLVLQHTEDALIWLDRLASMCSRGLWHIPLPTNNYRGELPMYGRTHEKVAKVLGKRLRAHLTYPSTWWAPVYYFTNA